MLEPRKDGVCPRYKDVVGDVTLEFVEEVVSGSKIDFACIVRYHTCHAAKERIQSINGARDSSNRYWG